MPPLFVKATTVLSSFVASSIRPVSQLPAIVLLLLPMGARRVMLWSATPRTSDMSPFTASQEAWLMARTVGSSFVLPSVS